ncbi:hypothetical protein [Spirosoma sp. KUDC1026]|uniref:hypothetical protein n=1 Tax=Spirosoma sp. KUDC1026 TaxID=2745947 RepID=UPI00159B9E7C|nr:hypothetical protein [Spirosoma sp. KUDC1026]QKZ12624.1 hypothetical protein HU175_08255 [Spirosoma sp. KUDC1026]
MKRILILIAFVMLATASWAQVVTTPDYSNVFQSPYEQYVTFNFSARYGVSFPFGGQQRYIDRINPANVAIDGEWLFPKRFSIGLKTGYQYSQQRMTRGTYEYVYDGSNQTISAVQTRTLSIIPAMASFSYYFADNAAAVRPYVQLAGGGAYVNYTNYFGTLADQNTGFKGAFAPAIGLKFYGKTENKLGAEIQAQYQNVYFNYDQLRGSAPSLMLSAGIIYRWY